MQAVNGGPHTGAGSTSIDAGSVAAMESQIRPGRAEDLPAVAAIYNAGIDGGLATFETRLRTVEELEPWATDGRPFVVAVAGGEVLGWARASSYSARPVYAGVAEHAVYVAASARGRGIGPLLLLALCDAAEAQGIYKLTSRVFAENVASRRAHAAAGFEEAGLHRRHGRRDGRWVDNVLVEKLLGDAAR